MRPFAFFLLLSSAALFFAANWFQALGFAYLYAGKIWMVIGFFFAGVGVFFIAFVGALIQGQFMNAFLIVVALAISFVVYWLGMLLVIHHAEKMILANRLSLDDS